MHQMTMIQLDYPYNHKAQSYTRIKDYTHRYQEILLGDLDFLTKDLLSDKTIEGDDNMHGNTGENCNLYKCREATMEEYAQKQDVQNIEEFTAFLHDEQLAAVSIGIGRDSYVWSYPTGR